MVNFKFFKPLVLLAFLIPIHAHTKTAQKIFPMISESPVHSFTITLRQSYVDPSLGKWPIKRTPAEAILVEYNSNVLLLPPTMSSILLEVEEATLEDKEDGTCVFAQKIQSGINQVQLPPLEAGKYLLRIHLEETVYEGLFDLP